MLKDTLEYFQGGCIWAAGIAVVVLAGMLIRRGKDKPISDLKVVSSKGKDAQAPDGYTMIKQDLNEKAGGKYIYLCYK